MRNCRRRSGMTLLELVIASSMLAVVVTTISVVLRSSRQAWEAHEADYTRIEAAHATLRHLVREVRQADAVSEISAATDDSGRIGLRMPSGDVNIWDHDSGTNTVNYTTPTASGLLAPEITGLRLRGFESDGTTLTTVPADVQFLEISVMIQLPRETSGARVVTSYAWIRSW